MVRKFSKFSDWRKSNVGIYAGFPAWLVFSYLKRRITL